MVNYETDWCCRASMSIAFAPISYTRVVDYCASTLSHANKNSSRLDHLQHCPTAANGEHHVQRTTHDVNQQALQTPDLLAQLASPMPEAVTAPAGRPSSLENDEGAIRVQPGCSSQVQGLAALSPGSAERLLCE